MRNIRKPSFILVILVWLISMSPGMPVEAVAYALSGRVFTGAVGDESSPISNVTLQLFGSSDPNYLTGTVLDSTVTDGVGWYELHVSDDIYPFYSILKYDPLSYYNIGATSIGGVVVTSYLIQYTTPLSGKALSGNKFWDQPGSRFQGQVFSGAVGFEGTPISNVTMQLFGSNLPNFSVSTLMDSTVTDFNGWYGLDVTNDIYSYYMIIEYDLGFFNSTGATSVGGVVANANNIEYTAPLSGKTLTGNKFWDAPGVAEHIFEGRVYSGLPGQEVHPMAGVAVRLYVADYPYPATGILVDWMTTDAAGWYQLGTSLSFAYFQIVEEDPAGYFSTGATTVDGLVRANNIIEYDEPLIGETLTGNKFWDRGAFQGFLPVILRK